ncbi:MAG: tRNA (guanosine(46)-N7)-methyltransferase TrmB [bacterium]|nr:tRNA (guanosine(46)-N7)-methyltransferase TrmB [bacterium]
MPHPHAISPRLSSHTLPWPPNWDAIFGAHRPLILEIGFGRGAFLAHLARTYPDHHVIGVEISNRSLEATERLIAREALGNVRLIHAMAETALAHLFQPASLSQIHLNFPDPWFKTRHSHRRIMRRAMIDWMVSRLAPAGMFYLATDIRAYAEMSAALLAETPALANTLPAPFVHDLPGRVVTKYEATARQEGRDCHYFAYCRTEMPVPHLPVIEELAMPHAVIHSPLSLDALRDAFADHVRAQVHEGDTHVHLIDVYRGADSLLVEAAVSEATIDQRIAILILRRWREGQAGDYTIQLSTLGHPRSTQGIHRAVRLLVERLTALHPESRVLHHKLSEST